MSRDPKPTPVPRPRPTPVRRQAVLAPAPTPVAIPRPGPLPRPTPEARHRPAPDAKPAPPTRGTAPEARTPPAPEPKAPPPPPAPDARTKPAAPTPVAQPEPKPTPVGRRQPKPAPTPVPRPATGSRHRVTPATGTGDAKNGKPAAGIDPRIKRRRIAVTREAGRRRLKMLALAAGVALLAVGLVAATRSPLLDVDQVKVTGADHTPFEEIVAAADLQDTPQMLDIDPAAVARKLRRLPWVSEATASRQWPSTIAITLRERTESASIPAKDNLWAIADKEGRILALSPLRPDAMPSVAGAGPAEQPGSHLGPRGRSAMATAAALPMELRSKTVELTVITDGWIDLVLLGGGVVRLGDPTEGLPEKLEAAITVLRTLDPKSIRLLDVRVPRAPVLTRR